MKYTCNIQINAPLEKVVKLWKDENNFDKWQDGFKSIELLEGVKDTVGAKSKIVLEDKQRIELVETILSIDLPHEKIALYEHIHMTNTQATRFESIEENITKYTTEVEYTQFNGFMIKLFAKLFPGKFKQSSQKWMKLFKAFVESQD